MNKAFDLTIVLVDENKTPNIHELIGGLTANDLVYFGEFIPSENGKPIIYLCDKNYRTNKTRKS